MPVIYNDVDITEDVSVMSAVHEMNAGGRADILDIVFDDTAHLWSRWGPKKGDAISFKEGGTSTGKMYVSDISMEGEQVSIYATSTPPELENIYSKTWEEVYLSQILKETTPSYQLSAVQDVWYRYKSCSTKVKTFLNQMAELEGAVMTIYEDTVIFTSEEALESQEPGYEVDCAGANVKIRDDSGSLFDACVVKSGQYFGSFKASDGERLYRPQAVIPCGSDAEAFRYAKALLRMANREKTEIRWRGSLMPQLSAGITVKLINDDAPGTAGKKYCYRVRHDYGKNETTIYMRSPLEGY